MSVRSAIRTFVITATGYDAANVVAEKQKGPAPDTDHITIGRPASRATAPSYLASETELDGVLTQVYEQPVMYSVSINIYASDGWDLLDDIALARHYYENRKTLTDDGLTLIAWSDVRPVSEFGDTETEFQFQRDFEFSGTRQKTFTDYTLDVWTFEGEFESDAGVDTETYSFDFTEE